MVRNARAEGCTATALRRVAARTSQVQQNAARDRAVAEAAHVASQNIALRVVGSVIVRWIRNVD